jgi:hypothetical protein
MSVTTVHRGYAERCIQWTRCRDAVEGSDAIKKKRETYLPKLSEKMKEADYQAYLKRASWYGASGRTVQGLLGAIMRKPPKVEAPEQLQTHCLDVTLTGKPLPIFAKDVTGEVLTTGRAALLVDLPSDGRPTARPYWVRYSAEQVLNWRTIMTNGQTRLSLVVLREDYDEIKDRFETAPAEQYRVLFLDESGHYQVELYRRDPSVNRATADPVLVETIVPTVRGARLPYIPFVFIGPLSLDPGPDKPPLLDLFDVNISHYGNSADLEHGLHYTALPTPYVTGVAKDTALRIGSSTAWAIPAENARVGMLEFGGSGLGAIREQMQNKEKLMAVLGARLLEEQKMGVEAAEAILLRGNGEQSVLQSIAATISLAFTQALKWHAAWTGMAAVDTLSVMLNTDFFAMAMTSADLTALVASWQQGAISYDTLYYNLQKGEIARPGVDVDTERDLIAVQQPEPPSLDDEGVPPPVKTAA